MSETFQTELAPARTAEWGGYAASGEIDPRDWADQLYSVPVSGPWLCCYMIRRFGWPNHGSDPDKNLCSWCLTTPLNWLCLCITPYMGTGNFHFAVRFDESHEGRMFQESRKLTPEVRKAVEVALADLQRVVFVRDIPITPFGRLSDSELGNYPEAEPFADAGYTPLELALKNQEAT